MTHDEEFLGLYADGMIVETIDSNEIAFLLKRSADHFKKYGAPLTREALLMMLEAPQLAGVKLDHEVVLHYFDNAPEPSESLRAYLFDHARTWFQTRAMQNAMDHAADLLNQGQVLDAQDLLARSAVEVGGIGDDDYGVEIVSDFEEFVLDLQGAFGEDNNAIPCGISGLDRAMRGGLRPGELGVFMGPPGRGKSHALVQTARHALLLGKNVVYYTLEMSWLSVLSRVWSGIIDRPNDADFVNQVPLIRDYLARLEDSGAAFGSLIVKAYPSHQATVPMLMSHIAGLERNQGWKPDLVVVDYGDILAAKRHFDVRRDELATVYEDLRGMGRAPPVMRVHERIGEEDHISQGEAMTKQILHIQYFGGPADGEVERIPPRDVAADVEAWLAKAPQTAAVYQLRRHWHGHFVLSWVGTLPGSREDSLKGDKR